jgi:hypothetical protein
MHCRETEPVASLYGQGTDELTKQLKSNFPDTKVIKNQILIDYDKQYYWTLVTVSISLFDPGARSFLDTSTKLGLDTEVMLNDLENTKKVKGDMKSIESKVIEFVTKRYPDISKLESVLGNKSIDKTTPSLPVSSNKDVKDQSKSTAVTTLYTDSKNGFSIDQPKGWEVHTTGGPQGTLVYFSDPKDLNNKLEVAYANLAYDLEKSLNDVRSLYGHLGTITDEKNIKLGSYNGTYISLLLNDKVKRIKKVT